MAKSTDGKKKRTAAALAGTLSAFTEAETDAPEAETDGESPPEPAADQPVPKKGRATAKPKPAAKTAARSEAPPDPPRPADSSRIEGLKAGLSRIARRQESDADISAETLRTLIESWLAACLEQAPPSPEWVALVQTFPAGLETWPESALRTFYHHWRQYCTRIGFELSWLVEDALKNSPLKPKLQRLALDYIAVYQRAQPVRAEIRLFERYLAWRQDLAQPRYRSLNQTLFVRLSYKEVIPPPPPDIYMAATEAREAYIRQALLKAADRDRATFLATLAEAEA